MTTNHQAAGAALFDVEILRRHVDAGWLKARIGETLGRAQCRRAFYWATPHFKYG